MRDCEGIRDLLAEHAVGVLPAGDRPRVDRHLAWCAGCRKEAAELAEGAEAAAHLAGRTEPPAGLEDRVVRAVRGTSARRSRRAGRAAVVLAAVVTVMAMGWGVTMADRAQRLEGAAELAREDAIAAAERYAAVIGEVSGRPVREAVLRPLLEVEGGGRALLYDADGEGVDSWVLIVAGGLDPEAEPYRARLLGEERPLRVGRLFPSAEGRHAAYLLFRGDAGRFAEAVVVDGAGRSVLRGSFNG